MASAETIPYRPARLLGSAVKNIKFHVFVFFFALKLFRFQNDEAQQIGNFGFSILRVDSEKRWKLSLCENRSRMRLKLIPNAHFDPHIQASRLRDNAG